MRTTVTLDDKLLAAAKEYSGVTETPALIRLMLKSFVEREAGRQLAMMGGSAPDIEAPPRRRFDPK